MRFTQLNQRHITPTVGRIILEDADGHAVYSVVYDIAPIRRASELFCEDGVFVARTQDEDGVWRYRYDRMRSPAQPADEHLHDYTVIPIPCCPTCGRAL